MRKITAAQIRRAFRRKRNEKFVPYFRVGGSRSKIGTAKIASLPDHNK